MNVGLVGAGRIGTRRADVLRAAPVGRLAVVADVDARGAAALAAPAGARATTRWEEVVEDRAVDAVVVATPNHLLTPVALAALERGKHVLVEKPMGHTPDDVRRLRDAARRHGVRLKCGFNHREHPAVRRAWELARAGAIGEPMFVRARYGHGGRPGYEGDWRGRPETAGGGEWLDQGIHLVDLARWFLGDFEEVSGAVTTAFWPVAPLEDNAFALLRTRGGRVASLHASWTQWKNLFSFEVFGRDGALLVEGLGGSYGPERLIRWRRREASGPPEEEITEFPGRDESWAREWADFVDAIRARREPLAGGDDGLAVMRTVHAVYEAAKARRWLRVEDVFP
jgi:predicted dehydrogenase